MKTANLHKLILNIEVWKKDGCGPEQVAQVLGWPPGQAVAIFSNIGIAGQDGHITPNLTTDQILIALLWYNLNTLLRRTTTPEGRLSPGTPGARGFDSTAND